MAWRTIRMRKPLRWRDNGLPWPQDIRQGKNTRIWTIFTSHPSCHQRRYRSVEMALSVTPGDQWTTTPSSICARGYRITIATAGHHAGQQEWLFLCIDRVNGEFICWRKSQISGPEEWIQRTPMINRKPITRRNGRYGVSVQMHNASQILQSPDRIDLRPIKSSSTFSFTAAETFTPNPGNRLGFAPEAVAVGAVLHHRWPHLRLMVPFAGEQMATPFVAEFLPHGTRRHRRNGGTPWVEVRPMVEC
jgi:hypothetical protein